MNESTRSSGDAAPESPQGDRCVSQLKVLADATRLAVIRRLLKEPQQVGDLKRALGVEQSLLSHHLRILREAGLVLDERVGKSVLYRLAPGVKLDPKDASIHLGCCRLSFAPADAATESDT